MLDDDQEDDVFVGWTSSRPRKSKALGVRKTEAVPPDETCMRGHLSTETFEWVIIYCVHRVLS